MLRIRTGEGEPDLPGLGAVPISAVLHKGMMGASPSPVYGAMRARPTRLRRRTDGDAVPSVGCRSV